MIGVESKRGKEDCRPGAVVDILLRLELWNVVV